MSEACVPRQRAEHAVLILQINAPGLTIDFSIKSPTTLQPFKLVSNVERPGEVVIDGLYINGENQFLRFISKENDAYEFSVVRQDLLQKEFLTHHRIAHLSAHALQDYLDEHELSMPEVGRFYLPVIGKNAEVRVTGKLAREMSFAVMLLGMQIVSEKPE